jgi:hypothetical protein
VLLHYIIFCFYNFSVYFLKLTWIFIKFDPPELYFNENYNTCVFSLMMTVSSIQTNIIWIFVMVTKLFFNFFPPQMSKDNFNVRTQHCCIQCVQNILYYWKKICCCRFNFGEKIWQTPKIFFHLLKINFRIIHSVQWLKIF